MSRKLTLPEAARILGCHRDTLHYHVTRGTLPAEFDGKRYLVRESDLHLVQGLKSGFPAGAKRMKARGRLIKKGNL